MHRLKLQYPVSCIIVFIICLLGVHTYSNATRAATGMLKDLPMPKTGDKILILSPHPDDETIAVGGYIYEACQAGAQVKIVLATDGNKHGLKIQRYHEFQAATAKLGVRPENLIYWDLHDGKLKNAVNTLTLRLSNEIEQYRPDVFIYPHPEDYHPDHAVLGHVAEKSLASLKVDQHLKAYRYLVHYWFFPQPHIITNSNFLSPPPEMSEPDQEWGQFILDTEAKSNKNDAVHLYDTQLKNPFLKPLLLGFVRENELFARWIPPHRAYNKAS